MQLSERVHISNMSGKLDGLRAINTNTLTNPLCNVLHQSRDDFICAFCYSMYMLQTHRSKCAESWQRNSDLLSGSLLHKTQIPTFVDKAIRLHAHGEIIDEYHLINFFRIAENNPLTTFSLWSKNKKVVRAVLKQYDKPSNLILIYSNGSINKPMSAPPKGFDKVFQNVSPDRYTDIQNCTGQTCVSCMLCYNKGTDVITEAVKLRYKRKELK